MAITTVYKETPSKVLLVEELEPGKAYAFCNKDGLINAAAPIVVGVESIKQDGFYVEGVCLNGGYVYDRDISYRFVEVDITVSVEAK